MVDVLRSCLHAATEDGIIDVNPAARLGALAAKARKPKPVEAFTADTLVSILDTAKVYEPSMYPLVLLLARTGLRLGEALALQVGDIQLDTRTIHVRRTWGSRRRAHGPARFNVPKGGAVRTVDMSKQLTAAMKVYLADRADPEAWVFAGREPGEPYHPVSFLFAWRRLLARAGVPYRKPHTLRHTYASLLIQNGEGLAYVRDQLGHSSIKITVDTYGHLIPGMNHAAVDRLDALGRATPTQPRASEQETRNHEGELNV
jgi:integrase